MLDRNLIRKEPEFVRAQALRKGVNAPVDEFLSCDNQFRQIKVQSDEKKAEMNRISKSIGTFMAQGKKEEAEAAKAEAAALKSSVQELETQERELEERLGEIELLFPNLPHESVPDGKSEEDNVVIREWQAKPDKEHVPHWDICEKLGLADFERATKITGSGFIVYTGAGARLVRSLINFMLSHQTVNNDYKEIWPPAMVNEASLIGTGNLPKFEEDLYKTRDDFYLIPTAEVPVTNLYRDEILDLEQLPIKLAAYTPCFRREAGAAGRDTRGVLRTHQFDKVELVQFVAPETSYEALESLTQNAEDILQLLGLHYRVIVLCTGDMGEKGSKTYDLEVWSPGVERYLEVSSCTNFEAYQSRRARIRMRREKGGPTEPVHILNGSGLAVPRLLAALLETYYDSASNSVRIPPALVPFFGSETITEE
ncbi:MAG: serine--tRNA ligase [Fimbriimonadaceae bacterium]|nr:serine--tRNA ligase [Fimbriimonadaceae bacterium]